MTDAATATPPDVQALFALEQLEVEEVSLVDRGDNPVADIVLVKRAQASSADAQATDKMDPMHDKGWSMRSRMKADDIAQRCDRAKGYFVQMLGDLMVDDMMGEDERVKAMEQLVGEYAEEMADIGKGEMGKSMIAVLEDTEGDLADIVKALQNEISEAVGASVEPAEAQAEATTTAGDKPAPEDTMAEKAAAKAEGEEPKVEAEKGAPVEVEAPIVDLAKVQAERDELAKTVSDLKATLGGFIEKQAEQAELAKVKAEFARVPGVSAEDLAKALRVVKGASGEAYETVCAALKAADALAGDNLAPVSTEAAPVGNADPVDEVLREAEKIAERDGISVEKATLKLFDEKPALVAKAFNGGQ